jgi:hypothetical protein
MKPLLLLVTTVLSCAAPVTVLAQTVTAVTLQALDPPRWDVSGDIGWLSSNKSEIGPEWDDWTDNVLGGALIGRYLTDHFKTELRLSAASASRLYEEQRVVVPGEPFPIFRLREHHFQKTSVAAGAQYQFFHNQWFHPNLGGGVEIVRERDRQYTPPWQVPIRLPGQPPIVVPEARTETTVTWRARPFAAAGFKWYVSQRAFTRSDVRVSFNGRGVADAAWTAGIGVDL